MAEKPPAVAVLHERLTTAVRVGSYLGGAFVAATITCASFFLSKLMDHGEKLAQVQGTLNQISIEQKKAVPSVVGELLQKPTPAKLAAAAAVLESAKKHARLSDSNLLASIGSQLKKDADLENTPEYWNAASALISYRSFQVVERTLPIQVEQMGPCKAQHPSSTLGEAVQPGTRTVKVNPQEYVGCELQLDSPAAAEIVARTVVPSVKFKNCNIIYRGGPVPVRAEGPFTYVFTDCAFDVSSPDVPPSSGRVILADLLSNPNLANVSVLVAG